VSRPNDLWCTALDLVGDADVVLDVGTGHGEFTSAALSRGAVVIAVDASKLRCDRLTAAYAEPRLRVLNVAAVATIDSTFRFVDRPGVRRVVRSAADDGEVVEMISVADLIARFAPRLVRFRAIGHESALSALAVPAVLVESDALAASWAEWPPHLAQTRGGVRSVEHSPALLPSRHEGLFGTAVSTATIAQLSDEAIAEWAQEESFAREPRRRIRLAKMLRQLQPLPGELSNVADRLWLDPADDVVDAMVWRHAAIAALPSTQRVARRLVAFESLTDRLATAPNGVERPAPLSLPR
jgi:SAM-dependent methyltransferase